MRDFLAFSPPFSTGWGFGHLLSFLDPYYDIHVQFPLAHVVSFLMLSFPVALTLYLLYHSINFLNIGHRCPASIITSKIEQELNNMGWVNQWSKSTLALSKTFYKLMLKKLLEINNQFSSIFFMFISSIVSNRIFVDKESLFPPSSFILKVKQWRKDTLLIS